MQRHSSWSLAKINIVVEFELKAFLNSIGGIIGQLVVEPIAYITLLAAGLEGWNKFISTNGGRDISYLTFAFPGILALQLVRIFARSIYRITTDRRWGLQAIKMVAGTGTLAYVLGMAIVPIGAFVVQSLVAAPVAITLGARFAVQNLFVSILVGVVAALFWSTLAMLFTVVITNYIQRDLIINLSLLPLSFSAPLLYPLHSAPHYLQMIALFNPLTYQVGAMRAAFLGQPMGNPLFISIILSMVVLISAVTFLSRSELLPSER